MDEEAAKNSLATLLILFIPPPSFLYTHLYAPLCMTSQPTNQID